jgi:hypothetical protein
MKEQHWYDQYQVEFLHSPVVRTNDLAPVGKDAFLTYDTNKLYHLDVRLAYEKKSANPLYKVIVIGGEVFHENYIYTLDGVLTARQDSFDVVTKYRLSPSMKLTGASVKLPWESDFSDIWVM